MTHRYQARVRWTGSTAAGYESYDRGHEGLAPPAEQSVRLTTGERLGDPRLLNPEQLVVMAASSCQLLFFLHLAAKARIDVVEYVDEASRVMPDDDPPVRLTRITLRPHIVVNGGQGEGRGPSEDQILRLVRLAHEHCYIANSLRTEVLLEPHIERR
ncbi:MAG TPA: OsmC family protein [Thermoleophilaceae bacterium]|nr:OsmC family protein [Thermoleophilaceae bacterium]